MSFALAHFSGLRKMQSKKMLLPPLENRKNTIICLVSSTPRKISLRINNFNELEKNPMYFICFVTHMKSYIEPKGFAEC